MQKPTLRIVQPSGTQQLMAEQIKAQEILENAAGAGVATHASTHITSGTDEMDGDQLDIDFSPSNYTPATTPSEVTSLDHLTSHLYGIDQELADKIDEDGSVPLTADWDIGNGRAIQADEIKARDGDGLKLYDDGGNGIFVEDGGAVGIGTESPSGTLNVLASGTFAGFYLTSYRNSAFSHAFIGGRAARGTEGTPLAVNSDDELARLSLQGYNGTGFHGGADITVRTTEAFSGSAGGAKIVIGTTANGATVRTDRLTIDQDGEVGIGVSSPTAPLDISGDTLRLRTSKTPASAGASGNQGDIAWDSSYLYICTASNTWRRVAHATW